MIALVFVACLSAEPAHCEERHLIYAEAMTPMACVMNAQPQLAQWGASHPGWRIARWRCGRADRLARKA